MGKEELFGQYRQTGNPEIRNAIVEKYLYMVDILIRKYLNKGVEYDDLYQVGAMALVSAVERFDPDKGFEFSRPDHRKPVWICSISNCGLCSYEVGSFLGA